MVKKYTKAQMREFGKMGGRPRKLVVEDGVLLDGAHRVAASEKAVPVLTRVTKVISVHQSPLNPVRWCLTLECGHELWVTAKRRPKTRTAHCHESHEHVAA